MKATLTVHELQPLLADGSVRIIDVLLPEDFACRHIPAAGNACVYEMVFLDRIKELVPELDEAVIVYDGSGLTRSAQTAKEKLERAGYRNVAVLEGGLRAWQEAGFAVESTIPSSAPAPVHDSVYYIDTEKSVVEWSGRNINNRHFGRIAISGGEVVLANGLPVTGTVVLDMDTITDIDLQDESWRNMLLRHLKSEDFFDVERYPTVTFEIRGASAIAECSPGIPNVEIAGSLSIRETTRSICFPAIIAVQEDGCVKAQASIDIDRTLWDVSYGSGKVYERLGMHLVNDFISIELFIVAREAGIAAC